MPDITLSIPAIVMAVLAQFFLGLIWYGIAFRHAWMRIVKYDPQKRPDNRALAGKMGLMLLGNVLMAWVMAHNIAAWSPLSWGQDDSGPSALVRAALAAFFSWLGFVVPLLLNSVAWGKKSWPLFAIHASYYLVAMFLTAAILTHL